LTEVTTMMAYLTIAKTYVHYLENNYECDIDQELAALLHTG